MNRTIKFRGVVNAEVFVREELFDASGKSRGFHNIPKTEKSLVYARDAKELYNFFYGLDDGMISDPMQFTGLYDCDGKEIYDGDVVEYVDRWSEKKRRTVVKIEVDEDYMECCPFSSYQINEQGQSPPNECKIVGNVFENPELVSKNND